MTHETVKVLLAHLARIAALIAALAATSCAATTAGGATTPSRHSAPSQARAAAPAVSALRAARFAEALRLADAALERDANNARANVVAAIVRYKRAMHALADTALLVLRGRSDVDRRAIALRGALERSSQQLVAVERHLAAASAYGDFSLELCVACWQVDWNRDGRINGRDARLFAVERDAHGVRIAADDARRRPTFRFDVGDIYWARAFVSFNRAALELALAYDWRDIEQIVRRARRSGELRIPLIDKRRVHAARALLLAGLGHSNAARRAYLAETDDRREWLPNPRQKDHPLPLPVDAKLYQTWRGVLGDLTALVESKAGLGLRDLFAAAIGPRHRRHPRFAALLSRLPDRYIDVGRMLRQPGDLVVDLRLARWRAFMRDPAAVLRRTFGDALRANMTPSALSRRLQRVRDELRRRESTLGRKLRYLLWIN